MACLAKSVVFNSAAPRPGNGQAAGGSAPKRAASKLWTPGTSTTTRLHSIAEPQSPVLIVAPDAESKMRGLSAKRREVILDMNDFAENEVRYEPHATPPCLSFACACPPN